MTKLLLAMLFMFSNISTASLHPARPKLPLCTEENGKGLEIQLHCIVYSDQFLDYNEIRTYTASRSQGEKFNVSINCYNGGKIYLPWPFFAENVVTLHVTGCINEGFLAERSKPQVYPDHLRQVVLSNIRNKVTIPELRDSILNLKNMTAEFDCGPTKARVQIFRNIEYVFPPLTGSLEEMILMEELMSLFTLKDLLSYNTVCRYKRLRYLEESGSRSFSRYHMKLMETSQYPNLKVYSLRNNSFTSVPVELENMRSSFLPKLSILDLSDNNIENINFKFSTQNKQKLLIDLKRNTIRSIDKNQLQEILNTKNVVLDLRENPLVCTCEIFSYGEYLFNMPSNAVARDIYKETTCQYEQNGILKHHSLSEKELHTLLCSV